MQSLLFILLLGAITIASADKKEEALNYMDKVLAELPLAVERAGLDEYEMPHFSYVFQNRSSDGSVLNSKIDYHTGTLSGLNFATRKLCQEPFWSSSNISFACYIVFPKLESKYEGHFQEITGLDNGVRFRQHEFTVELTIENYEAKLEVTSSPHIRVPTIKRLDIEDQGTLSIRFKTDEKYSFDQLSAHFHHKFNKLFEDVFFGPFKNALEEAVGSVSYPEQTLKN